MRRIDGLIDAPARPAIPAAGDHLRGQRAGRLDGDHRPLGARLRPAPAAPWRPRRSSSGPASCPPCWRRSWSPGSSSRRPRFALPVIYCGEAAAFGALALLAAQLLAAGGDRPGDDRRRPGAGRARADPRGRRRPARAGRRAARRQRAAQRRLHRRRRDRARHRRPGRRRLRRPDGAAARRRLLLRDRLDPVHRRAAAPGRARTGPGARAGPRRARLHPRDKRPCAGC